MQYILLGFIIGTIIFSRRKPKVFVTQQQIDMYRKFVEEIKNNKQLIKRARERGKI